MILRIVLFLEGFIGLLLTALFFNMPNHPVLCDSIACLWIFQDLSDPLE